MELRGEVQVDGQAIAVVEHVPVQVHPAHEPAAARRVVVPVDGPDVSAVVRQASGLGARDGVQEAGGRLCQFRRSQLRGFQSEGGDVGLDVRLGLEGLKGAVAQVDAQQALCSRHVAEARVRVDLVHEGLALELCVALGGGRPSLQRSWRRLVAEPLCVGAFHQLPDTLLKVRGSKVDQVRWR